MSDDETIAYIKSAVAAETGIPAQYAHRLRGSSLGELRDDAKTMAKELGLVDLTERARDEGGHFTSEGADMNQRIRAASGRHT